MQPGESAGLQSERRRRKAEDMRRQAQALTEGAQRLDRSAEMWSRGHLGEQTVGAQLELLRRQGFVVVHDVRWPGRRRANIDHVAVGPPGILVVDAKNWSGSVTVRDGVVRQNGYPRAREVEAVSQAARDVGSQLDLPWALHVIPVIALAGEGPGEVERCQDVTVLGHSELVPWVATLPPQLTPGDVLGIAAHLQQALPPASQPSAQRPRQHGRTRSVPREPSARERKRLARRKATRREALMRLAVLAVLVMGGPTAVAWWTTHGVGVVAAVVPSIPAPSTSTPVSAETVPAFSGCRALRVAYPHGVKRPGSQNAGRSIRGGVVADAPTYRANKALDLDRDGIACELPRKQ